MPHRHNEINLGVMHELALLYMGLAAADQDVDDKETKEIAMKLRRWQPDRDPALIDHVIRDATLTFRNGCDDERLRTAAAELRDQLGEDLRLKILHDLADIAYADGQVQRGEVSFIHDVESIWQLNLDQENVE